MVESSPISRFLTEKWYFGLVLSIYILIKDNRYNKYSLELIKCWVWHTLATLYNLFLELGNGGFLIN